ncbi:MAG TPA: spondin domain-containing protein [Candidatus Paceibacterota bacterium]|nr:spondin domain-containing protein [Candidatus Paceibacterota bacterium]
MNKRTAIAGFGILAAAALVLPYAYAESADNMQASGERVRITVENLTTSQGFSPSVFFTHNTEVDPLFVEGEKASFGVARMAEDGNPAPIAGEAAMKIGKEVGEVKIPLPVGPGKSQSIELMVDENRPYVSGAWMLGRTNDGFAGFGARDILNATGTQTFDLYALDAGTEVNDEKRESLPALMGTNRNPEDAPIMRHSGIRGDADAPPDWKFDPNQPVARVTIERM